MHTVRACTHTDMHSSVVRTHVHVWHFDKCTSDCLEVASTMIVRSCITSYIYTQFIPCHQDSIHFLHWNCLITFLWQGNWLSRTDPQTNTKIITSLQTAPSCTGSDWNRLWPSSSGMSTSRALLFINIFQCRYLLTDLWEALHRGRYRPEDESWDKTYTSTCKGTCVSH